MGAPALNLRNLRTGRLPQVPIGAPYLKALLTRFTQGKLSRRTLLKMLGTALPVPAVIVTTDGRYKTFQIARSGGGRIAFVVGGVDRWVIDPKRFAGHPG